MTSYTDNRGYPYPSSEREAGNGGAHSERLARAVAADLDVLDASWAAEMQHSTEILVLTSNITGIPSGTLWPVFMHQVEKKTTGLGLGPNDGDLNIAKGGDGWYHVCVSVHAAASGTITAGAWHRIYLSQYAPFYGNTKLVDERYSETYQSGTVDVYGELEGMFRLRYGDFLRLNYQHANTGSTVNIVVAGTSLAATKICGV